MAFFEEINTKEELYDVLTSIYDVEEKTALIIVENLGSRHRLSESALYVLPTKTSISFLHSHQWQSPPLQQTEGCGPRWTCVQE